MKSITLTSNEVLVLISEGMTMNNCKSLANKLRNADAPVPAISPSVAAYEKALKDVTELSAECTRRYNENEELKQKVRRLESEIRDWENDAKQGDESLKYFLKWVEELRVALDCDKGMTTAGVFSEVMEYIKNHTETVKALNNGSRQLTKAGNVIEAVKRAYDNEGSTLHKAICDISDVVEAYYRGN